MIDRLFILIYNICIVHYNKEVDIYIYYNGLITYNAIYVHNIYIYILFYNGLIITIL